MYMLHKFSHYNFVDRLLLLHHDSSFYCLFYYLFYYSLLITLTIYTLNFQFSTRVLYCLHLKNPAPNSTKTPKNLLPIRSIKSRATLLCPDAFRARPEPRAKLQIAWRIPPGERARAAPRNHLRRGRYKTKSRAPFIGREGKSARTHRRLRKAGSRTRAAGTIMSPAGGLPLAAPAQAHYPRARASLKRGNLWAEAAHSRVARYP